MKKNKQGPKDCGIPLSRSTNALWGFWKEEKEREKGQKEYLRYNGQKLPKIDERHESIYQTNSKNI